MTAPTQGLFVRQLPNGLTLLGQPMPDVVSAACCFYVRVGAREEAAAHSGVSHFLEHMVFKGTATRSGPEIDRAFEEVGADHNAATSVEYTYYWARVLGDRLERVVDLLADMMRPRLAAADLDAERHVILEEIARAEDAPDRVAWRALMEGFFPAQPLGNSILGSRESILAMPIEGMREHWSHHYGAANMVFAVSGNIDPAAVFRDVERLCGDWHAGGQRRVTRQATMGAGVRVLTRATMQHQIVVAALPSMADGDPDHYAGEVVSTVLGDRTGSRLYWGVRERGLAQSAVASINAFTDTGMLVVHLRADPGGAPAAWEAARRELNALQADGPTAAELERAKTKLISRLVMDGESTTQRMLALLSSWVAVGRLETLEEVVAAIDAVTLGDCRRVLDRFPLTNEPLVVTLGPLTPEAWAG